MDVIKVCLLLAAIFGQPESGMPSAPTEQPGQVINMLENTELFQWQKSKTERGDGQGRLDGTEDVSMVKAWSNSVSNFYLTCSKKLNSFKALVFTKQSHQSGIKYNSIKILEMITSCEDLERSVAIVELRDGQSKKITVTQNGNCKMDGLIGNENTVITRDSSCIRSDEDRPIKNDDGFINGWKVSSDSDDFKDYVRLFQWKVNTLDWNEDTADLKAWSNDVVGLYLTCARKGDHFRAIIFTTKREDVSVKYYAIWTLDVNSCEDSLLRSVTVLVRKMGSIQLVLIGYLDGSCKTYGLVVEESSFFAIAGTCPRTDERDSKNDEEYINGWKVFTQVDDFKDDLKVDIL